MSKFDGQDGWSKGMNNRANWRDMPAGSVRSAVNLDALESGVMALRTGYKVVYAGSDVRGALAVGTDVLLVDGANLMRYDTTTGSSAQLATVAAAGGLVGDVLNEELFFCTLNESFRYSSGVLRRWGVPTAAAQPTVSVVGGSLRAGVYQVAIAWVDAYGAEGGASTPLSVTTPDQAGLTVQMPTLAGYTPALYISSENGETLYKQSVGSGAATVVSIDDSGARLRGSRLREPMQGSSITAHNGCLVVATGGVLELTVPLRPHLVDRARGFFQYAGDIGFVISCGSGVYVSADKTYFLAGLESDQPEQREVLPYPGVPGTAVQTPSGDVAWMTKYGLAVGSGDGQVKLLSQAEFVPGLAAAGNSGIVESNGSQLVVSNVRGTTGQNPLAASDYYDVEIVTP